MKALLLTLIATASLHVWSMEVVSQVTLADGRTILAADNRLTLYTFDVDEPGVSNCHGGCLNVWPPMTVDDGTEVTTPFGLITRDSGELQLTFNQLPLYFFVGDQNEGDINGDNLNNVWHIIVTEGE